ncbi:hypothetical protein B0O99DRAFT_746674 [Bisporella sp. PMI_857]|nr:hypothetical protein B0O99DRAFT_746674 [Bisporella sp. PMI_857]
MDTTSSFRNGHTFPDDVYSLETIPSGYHTIYPEYFSNEPYLSSESAHGDGDLLLEPPLPYTEDYNTYYEAMADTEHLLSSNEYDAGPHQLQVSSLRYGDYSDLALGTNKINPTSSSHGQFQGTTSSTMSSEQAPQNQDPTHPESAKYDPLPSPRLSRPSHGKMEDKAPNQDIKVIKDKNLRPSKKYRGPPKALCSVFDGNIESLVKRKSRKPFTEEGKKKVEAVRNIGACFQCRFRKRTCEPKTPCQGCLNRAKNNMKDATALCQRNSPSESSASLSLARSTVYGPVHIPRSAYNRAELRELID